jgi:hypothetical protein
MNRFAYRAYYEFKSSKSAPLRSAKTDDEIAFALSRFPQELPYCLPDDQATVTPASPQPDRNSSHVVVITDLDEATVDEAVKKCLDSLDLFAEKLGGKKG